MESKYPPRKNEKKERSLVTPEQLTEVLAACYEKAVQGVPGSKNCSDLAQEYLDKYKDPKIAAKKLISVQIAKCTTSGFVTSFGGLITLPVTIPANIASVLYVQMRMIAAIAAIGGYDTNSDEVQTLGYLCLVGSSVTDIVKASGVQVANKITMNMLKKLPGSICAKINKAVSFRLITKFGTKGVINLWKMVPLVGGVVGGGFDFFSTKAIADRAYNMFILEKID